MPAVCLTRPQYVLRSYCDSGSSRLPGKEADMLASALGAALPFSVFVFSPMLRGDRDGRALALGKPQERKAAGSCVTDSISCVN